MTPLIQCEGITRTYRKAGKNSAEITPLQKLDLTVQAGEFLCLMGPSGSGKTTLLNLLAGIDRPSSGSIVVDGQDICRLSRARLADWRASNVGYIFQLYNLVPVLTAYENVELPLLLHRLNRSERHERVCRALQRVALADRHDHYPNQLSGGQEQRVAIARALAPEPRILVADEPTGDLDAASAKATMSLLTELNEQLGQTLVMVTHDPNAAGYAHRTLHLEKGKLIEQQAVSQPAWPLSENTP